MADPTIQEHAGGCACGQIRYRAHGQPAFGLVCHCRACQLRLASAFAVIAYFNDDQIEFERGRRVEWVHHSDESGRWMRFEFCPNCGTTVSHTAQIRPGMRAIAGMTFDDPDWFVIERHIWVRSKRPWVTIPPGMPVFEQGTPGVATAQVGARAPAS